MSRITWTRTAENLERGAVGKHALFTLTDISTADSPLFALKTTLPTGRILWKRADPEHLKRHAEKVLATFVAELGAVFPTNTEEGAAPAAPEKPEEAPTPQPKRLSQKAVHEAIKATDARPLVDYVGQVLRDGGPRHSWVRLKDRFEDPRAESPAAAALISAFEANGWAVTASSSDASTTLTIKES